MVNIFRLIFFAVFMLLSGQSHALLPAVSGCATPPPSGEARDIYLSNGDASKGCVGQYNGVSIQIISGPTLNGRNCEIKWKCSNGSFPNSQSNYAPSLICPSNSIAVGAQCECKEGYSEQGNQCVKPDEDTPEKVCEDQALLWNSTLTPDRSARVFGPLTAYSDGGLVCNGIDEDSPSKGCKHWFTGDLGFTDSEGVEFTNGHSVALNKGDPRAGGSLTCNPMVSDPPKADDLPKGCENGYKGSVNGVDVCIEAWTGDTEGIDWTRVRDAEGNESDVKTTIKCKGDQCTIKEEKTTKNPGGTTTTTTTTTQENVSRQGYCARNPQSSICGREEDKSGGSKGQGGGGGGSGGGGGEGEGDGFCKENPDSPMCKEGTFGGSCMAGFQCDGDAIQCAIAKEQHARACKLFDDKSPESDLYNAEKGKEGNRTEDLPGNGTVDMNGRIDTSDAFGGGGAGVLDLNLTVAGHSVTLSLSQLNDPLRAFGLLLVAVSFLIAVRIIGRG